MDGGTEVTAAAKFVRAEKPRRRSWVSDWPSTEIIGDLTTSRDNKPRIAVSPDAILLASDIGEGGLDLIAELEHSDI